MCRSISNNEDRKKAEKENNTEYTSDRHGADKGISCNNNSCEEYKSREVDFLQDY